MLATIVVLFRLMPRNVIEVVGPSTFESFVGAWISSHKENIARFQSSGLTSFSQKAILRSILLISAPGPNSLIGPEEEKLRLAGHCRWC